MLLIVGGFLYTVYVVWCFVLLSLLPSSTGQLQQLSQAGLFSCIGGAIIFVLLGVFLAQRIATSKAQSKVKVGGFIKLFLTVIPGIVISIIVPVMILRPPTLVMLTDPSNADEFIAPLTITLSVENAVTVLKRLGQLPVQFEWDTDGDGKVNEKTAAPQITARFDKPNVYVVSVRIKMSDATIKKVSKRIIIPSAVFAIEPLHPVVEKPVRFSVEHLLTDPKLFKQVQWDFDGDGVVDETSTSPTTMHTYYGVGIRTVTAIVVFTTSTQQKLERTIEVTEPPPLPFPVTVTTEPKNLIGPPPLGVLFTITTDEPLKEVVWDFGDKKEERGADLKRVGHSYSSAGIYSTVVKVRSASGELAEITTLVRVTELLDLSDLRFEGSPAVKNNVVSGEVPLTVQITPKTAQPLIQFSWEVPDDPNIQVADGSLNAVYRREGKYNVTLIAQGPDGSALRQPITINVLPPATQPTITVQPTTGMAPLRVTFDASETYIPPETRIAGFKWLFGDEENNEDGGELGGSLVEHTYLNPGEYSVKLTIVTADGKEFIAERTIIVRKSSLSACILPSRTQVKPGEAVQFESTCTAGTPKTYTWDVRSSVSPNIVLSEGADTSYLHVFDQIGSYVVTLTITDVENRTSTDTVTIIVTSLSTTP